MRFYDRKVEILITFLCACLLLQPTAADGCILGDCESAVQEFAPAVPGADWRHRRWIQQAGQRVCRAPVRFVEEDDDWWHTLADAVLQTTRTLNLARCIELTDESICKVLPNAPHVTSLSLHSVDKLTRKALDVITQYLLHLEVCLEGGRVTCSTRCSFFSVLPGTGHFVLSQHGGGRNHCGQGSDLL